MLRFRDSWAELIMLDFNVLWILASLQCMILFTPGVSFAIVTRNSLLGGFFGGISTAFGISLAIAFHVVFSILGMALISESSLSFHILKYAGGVYLFWLSYKFWKSSMNACRQESKYIKHFSQVDTWYQFIRMGFLIDILNPYIFLFHLSTFIKIIPSSASLSHRSIYAGTIIMISFVWFSVVALILSNSVIEERLRKHSKWIEKCTSLVLLWFAFRFFL